MFDPRHFKMHDLTLPYNEKVAGYSDTVARTVSADGWNARWLKIYSHAGTHMDAPHHFGVNEQTIDEIAVERLMTKAWVIDVKVDTDRKLLGADLLDSIRDRIAPGDAVILRTGWSHRLGTDSYKDELPRISEELATQMVTLGVGMLAVEPPSVADVNDLEEVTLIHRILLEGDVIIVEGLCRLEQIVQQWVWLLALPLPIEGGDGAPARVIAWEPKAS